MHIRDQEISRLVKYAEGLGLKVHFSKSKKSDDLGEWWTDGSRIVIYQLKHTTKTEIILSLIHEIGHHVWFIHERNRNPDIKFDEALEVENLYATYKRATPPPKHIRKKILDVEIAGTKWWETIYKDTNMKFPKWKLKNAAEIDIWLYSWYYLNACPAPKKELRKAIKKITNKNKERK